MIHVFRLRRAATVVTALAAAALIAAGCGSSGGGAASGTGSAGLDFVPESALLYVVADANLDSDNWDQVNQHLKKFPASAKGVKAQLDDGMKSEHLTYDKDVKPWVGDTAGLALLSAKGGGTAGSDPQMMMWIDAKDESKAKAFGAKQSGKKLSTSTYDGTTITKSQSKDSTSPMYWTVTDGVVLLGDSEAAIKAGLKAKKDGKSITDADGVKDAANSLDDSSVVSLVASGAGIRKALTEAAMSDPKLKSASALSQIKAMRAGAFGFGAQDEGFKAHGEVLYDKDKLGATPLGTEFKPSLVEDLPADTIAALNGDDFGGLVANGLEQAGKSNPQIAAGLTQIEGVLGIKVDDLKNAYDGEFALAVRGASAAGIPPIGFISKVSNESKATTVTEKLFGASALASHQPPKKITVGGVTASQATVGPVTLTGAVTDGMAYIVTDPSFITDKNGDKLGDTKEWKDTTDAAKLPDQLGGLFFLDFQKSLALAKSMGQDPGTDLAAMGPWVAWVETGDDSQSFDVFMRVDKDAPDATPSTSTTTG